MCTYVYQLNTCDIILILFNQFNAESLKMDLKEFMASFSFRNIMINKKLKESKTKQAR